MMKHNADITWRPYKNTDDKSRRRQTETRVRNCLNKARRRGQNSECAQDWSFTKNTCSSLSVSHRGQHSDNTHNQLLKCFTDISQLPQELRRQVAAALPEAATRPLYCLKPGDYVLVKQPRRKSWKANRWQKAFQVKMERPSLLHRFRLPGLYSLWGTLLIMRILGWCIVSFIWILTSTAVS